MLANTALFGLGTVNSATGPQPALLIDKNFYILDDATLDSEDHKAEKRTTCLDLLKDWPSSLPKLSNLANKLLAGQQTDAHIAPSSAQILTPLLYPPKLLAVGANYTGHLKGMNLPTEKNASHAFLLRTSDHIASRTREDSA